MISFNKNNERFEFTFNGLKIIWTNNTLKTYKDLILNSFICINDIHIKKENIIYINELTIVDSFINLNKKSFIYNEIFDSLNSNIINWAMVNEIIDNLNQKYNYELLTCNDGDMNKIISLLFDMNELNYFDMNKLELLLKNNILDKNNLIILDNLSWLNIEKLKELLNNYNFLILTNDIRQYIKNINELEIIVNHNKNNYVDFLSSDKIISYLEKNLNQQIDNKTFYTFLYEKESLISIRIWFLLRNI